ncbi:MAG TPA: hypothetical protein VNM16_06165 [Bacillota bacterium]|nr:hypothetical protein [Bacillota bacterium]
MSEQSLLSRAHLRVQRRLPVFGEVLVAAGDAVQPWTVLARAHQMPGDPYVVSLVPAGRMVPDPAVLERGLHVAVGDTVAQDDVLCHLPGQDVRAPVAGRVELISLLRGRILLREDPKSAQPVVVIDAARQLDIWRAMLPMYMVRRVGEKIPRGGVIAAAPGARGAVLHVVAPAAGTLERIDTQTGYIYLVRPVASSEVRAFLQGHVAEVLPGEGAIVESEATVLQGVYGLGAERWGELLLAGEGDLHPAAVAAEAAGKVLAVGGRVTGAALARCRAVGVAGLVAASCDGAELAAAVGHELGSVTGREDLPFALVLTEGFGSLSMHPAAWSLLRSQSGRSVSLVGATQIRSGGVRPRVILYTETAAVRRGGDILPGGRVRVLRGRYFGRTGMLVAMAEQPRTFGSGALLAAAQVAVDGAGEPVWLPRANLESLYAASAAPQGTADGQA